VAWSTSFGRVETKKTDFVQIAALQVARAPFPPAFGAKNRNLMTYNQHSDSIFGVK